MSCKIKALLMYKEIFSIEHIADRYESHIKGKSGMGIDRMSIPSFEKNLNSHFEIIERKCKDGSYTFSPYLEKLISKGRDKNPRVISIPTLRDKLVISLYNEWLQKHFSEFKTIDLPNSRIRNFKTIAEEHSLSWLEISKIDMSAFYDTIDREILLEKLKLKKIQLSILSRMLSNETVPYGTRKADRNRFLRQTGIPQGLAVSNILAEIYASEIDRYVRGVTVFYDRYVDDILIVSRSSTNVQQRIQSICSRLKLKVNSSPTKTNYCCKLVEEEKPSVATGISYLGYVICQKKRNSELVITVRNESKIRFLNSIDSKCKSIFKTLEKLSGDEYTERLEAFWTDLDIRIAGAISGKKKYGWIFYFSEITDKTLLYEIDSLILKFLQKLSIKNKHKPKSIVRAYYKIRSGDAESYSHCYPEKISIDAMLEWLRCRGHILPGQTLTQGEIAYNYKKFLNKFLNSLDKDVGSVS